MSRLAAMPGAPPRAGDETKPRSGLRMMAHRHDRGAMGVVIGILAM
ncbi:MAG: hypothetical protein ACYCXG_07435 [Acidiferrobacter sp.]